MSAPCRDAPHCMSRKGAGDDDARTTASGTLRRLVTFLASALDVRYAFVLAVGPEGGGPRPSATSWLAKDYGLRSEVSAMDLLEFPRTPSGLDVLSILQRTHPHEPELAARKHGEVLCLPLVADGGRWLGYLGVVVDPEGRRILSAPEHLRPLARTAVAELLRWFEA